MHDDRMKAVIREGVETFVRIHCPDDVKGKFIRLFSSAETLREISYHLDRILPQEHRILSSASEIQGEGTPQMVQTDKKPYYVHKILGSSTDEGENILDCSF